MKFKLEDDPSGKEYETQNDGPGPHHISFELNVGKNGTTWITNFKEHDVEKEP